MKCVGKKRNGEWEGKRGAGEVTDRARIMELGHLTNVEVWDRYTLNHRANNPASIRHKL